MSEVRAKKHLGQHFLIDPNTARKIASTLSNQAVRVIEIGPGTGMLTRFLLERNFNRLVLVEIDSESVIYLKTHFQFQEQDLIEGDFLKMDLSALMEGEFTVTGNFPYNISSQILFKVLDFMHIVSELSGMFQKEVAERIVARHGNKTYGILSVLIQIYYEPEYLFTVNETVFNPPPKVKSAVIRLTRKAFLPENLNKELLFKVVKTAFNQRRKTLRNALSGLCNLQETPLDKWASKRAEQLSPAEFVELTKEIENKLTQRSNTSLE
ncbi:MAG TPA: 16S rRNA (adenine(1518)-N(6)/adenine(1519)-N(6))-dimethyltransferase [Bacteroidales bacterium]|nr:MAG: hypothetical protein A2X11_06775 [Bacteroidetes bacterium GWE2_42_24]OFY25988.1 MAG: hypothetical protein A2X09_04820 [Bacteroidetes bacterium GWF2_43_11]HBZ66600.1 16S rRNA (adenine(1518)-N(6)/adenine(1519)-N(6))-dimethyltransferase [Bacteroidales bacterium]